MGQKHFEAIPLTSLLRERDDKGAATLEKCSPAAILNFHLKNVMRSTKHQSTSFTGLHHLYLVHRIRFHFPYAQCNDMLISIIMHGYPNVFGTFVNSYYLYSKYEKDIDIDIDIDSIFYLDNTLSYGKGTSHRLVKQSLQDALASLQVREKKIKQNKQRNKQKNSMSA